MNTRFPLSAAIGCAAILLLALGCSFTLFAAQSEPDFGPCQLAGPLPFSLDEARALQQSVLDTFLIGATGPFELDVSSTALNSYVLWQTQGSPLVDPAVWFAPGRVCLRGTLAVFGPLQLHMAAAVRPQLVGDQVRLDIEYARLGRWALPGPARRYIADIANETIHDARLHIEVTQLQLDGEHLLVAGTRRAPVSRREILPQSAAARNVSDRSG